MSTSRFRARLSTDSRSPDHPDLLGVHPARHDRHVVTAERDLAYVAARLRARRQALQPENVGLPGGGRRRTPGLRREEAAALCAISPAYYGRLERHCGPRPSPIALARIARGLRFAKTDRDLLFSAAGYDPASTSVGTGHVAPGLMHVLDRLSDTPALVVDGVGGVLHQTHSAAALLGSVNDFVGWERSGFYRWFTSPRERDRFTAEEQSTLSTEIVADLRSGGAATLVRLLLNRSAEFAECWHAPDGAVSPARRCRIVHRELGVIELNREVLCEAEFRLVIYTAAPGSAAALDLATVLGHHRFEA